MTGKLVIDQKNSSIKVYDTTTWSLTGGDTVNIFLKVEVETSNGTVSVYDNLGGATSDIEVGTNTYKEVTTNIPTGPDGDLLQGVWKLTMNAEKVIGGTGVKEGMVYTYDLTYDWPKICLAATVDCSRSTIQSTDETDYGPYATITRAHTLYPPPASKAATKTTTLKTNIYNPIYTKTWTTEVISEVTFEFETYFVVIKELKGVKEFEVVCTTDLCKIMCCIREMFSKYNYKLQTEGLASANFFDVNILRPALKYISLYLVEERCGNQTKAAEAIQKIKDITGCGECNNCGGDEPVLVFASVPTGVTKNFIVDSPLNTITVTSDENDSEVIYHIDISESILNILNNIVNISLDTNTPNYIEIQPTTNPDGSVTWYVDLKDKAINDSIEARIRIYPSYVNPGDNYMSVEEHSIWLTGGLVNPCAIAPSYQLGITDPNDSADVAILTVFDFIHADIDQATPFTVHAQVMRMSDTFAGTYTNTKDIECEVFWASLTAPSFILRFYNPIDGTPLTLADLSAKNADIYISLQINIKKP